MKINIKGQKGQALPLVMIAVILGALVIPPFVGYAGSSMIGSHAYGDALRSQYAADSGVEHAIWRLTDDGLMDDLLSAGSSVTYWLDEDLNGLTTKIIVSNSWQPIAWDDFESGDWSGGDGWLDDWTHSGESSVTTAGSPFEGNYHLRMRGSSALVSRPVDLSNQVGVHLRFWAKVESFEWGDTALCQISTDGEEWITLQTFDIWTGTEYQLFDIDISSYEMTDTFWIRFDAEMSSSSDYFYVDKLDLVWLLGYPTQYAWEDFESGGWSGGGGWVDDWTHSGYSSVVWSWWWNPVAYEGWYCLQLQGDRRSSNQGDVRRAVDLSEAEGVVRLKFYAKVNGFESNDNAVCQVSSNGYQWSTLFTWTNDQDDNNYYPYNFSLNAYELTDEFWIRFRNNSNGSNDYFYVDYIEIVSLDVFGITAIAGDTVIKATVLIDNGVVTVLTWYYV
jgi:hypothetical protein